MTMDVIPDKPMPSPAGIKVRDFKEKSYGEYPKNKEGQYSINF